MTENILDGLLPSSVLQAKWVSRAVTGYILVSIFFSEKWDLFGNIFWRIFVFGSDACLWIYISLLYFDYKAVDNYHQSQFSTERSRIEPRIEQSFPYFGLVSKLVFFNLLVLFNNLHYVYARSIVETQYQTYNQICHSFTSLGSPHKSLKMYRDHCYLHWKCTVWRLL